MTETPNVLIQMPFASEQVPGPAGTDVLSDVLRVFRATGAALLRGDFHAPWAWATPPDVKALAAMLHPGATRIVMFHIVAEGSCWAEVEGGPRLWLQQGDVVCFPQGNAHSMGAGEAAYCVPLPELFPPPPWTELPVLRHGGNGEATRIVCMYLRCDDLLFNPLLNGLPNVLVARPSQGDVSQWLNANLRYLIAEANRGGAGSACLMARLTELLFIEMLRIYMSGLGEQDIGLLAALRDRHISRALHAFHTQPSRAWTGDMLARHAGLSRSALVERFRRLLGTSPGRYLMIWRLQLAAQALRNADESIAAIAARAGYHSEEAFGRAFKRYAGESPGNWRRLPRARAEDGPAPNEAAGEARATDGRHDALFPLA